MADDFKRITIRSLKDTSSGAYSIADYDKDMQAVERALKSALPKDAFYHKSKDINYNDPTFHQIGKLKEDFYIKASYTRVAQEAIDQALSKMLFKGSYDPKYFSTRTRPLTDKENATIKELEKLATQNKDSGEDAEGFRFRKSTLIKIVALITTLTDITRRILSSVVSMATQQLKDNISAHNLGLPVQQMRNYRRVETAHGMKEGTIAEALAGEQQKYGNVTSLDEKSLEYIALIMGNKVAEMATMGLGASNPEAIVEAIVDRANELANAGINSVGQYVGEAQARRELYSYLLKYSPQIADIFATMQEEQHNINSIFRGQVDTFEKFKNSVGTQRNVTQAGEGVLATTGQEWNMFKQTMDDIKYALAVSIAPYLSRILRRLNNMRVGMSETEKLRLNVENRNANEKALKETEASIALIENRVGGDISKLSASEKAYYDTLVTYRKNLIKENDKESIDNIVLTANEIKAEQERRIKSKYKRVAERAYYAETVGEAEEAIASYSFTDAEIMNVIKSQGTGEYGEKAFAKYKKEYVAWRKKEIIEELKKDKNYKYLPANALNQRAQAMAEAESVRAFARANYRFFYPTLLGLQSDRDIEQSYNDQFYDIQRVMEKWGANFEKLPEALPPEALGTHKIYSIDEKLSNGQIIHKVILDINDSNGVDKGDFELFSLQGNDRGGAQGSQYQFTWSKEQGITLQATAGGASSNQ